MGECLAGLLVLLFDRLSRNVKIQIFIKNIDLLYILDA